MAKYLVKHTTDEMYIHFNPHSQEYFVSDKQLGAAVFTESGGKALMREAELGGDWDLSLFGAQKTLIGDQSMEKNLFDKTH